MVGPRHRGQNDRPPTLLRSERQRSTSRCAADPGSEPLGRRIDEPPRPPRRSNWTLAAAGRCSMKPLGHTPQWGAGGQRKKSANFCLLRLKRPFGYREPRLKPRLAIAASRRPRLQDITNNSSSQGGRSGHHRPPLRAASDSIKHVRTSTYDGSNSIGARSSKQARDDDIVFRKVRQPDRPAFSFPKRSEASPTPPQRRGPNDRVEFQPMSEFLNVGSFSRNGAAGRVERPETVTRPERSSERHGRVDARDQVEISEHARHLAVLQTMPATRSAKIDAAKGDDRLWRLRRP